MHIEKEYKVLVTKAQLENLLACYSNYQIKNQTNYYFDTIPALKQKNIAVRIRTLNDKYIFTLKHLSNHGLEEYEREIKNFDINDPNIQPILAKFAIKDLFLSGQLHTTRYQIDDEYGSLCLDINTYNQKVDYEIEYELFDDQKDYLQHFKTILAQANISYQPNHISKTQRMYESLN